MIASDVNNDASTWLFPLDLFCTCTRRARTAWQTSYVEEFSHATLCVDCRGWYHGGRRPSSDYSFHSPTVIPPLALDRLSIMKCYHHWWTCSHRSPRCSPMIVTLHDTWFVECRLWNDVEWWLDCGKLSSLDSRQPPWYRPQVSTTCRESIYTHTNFLPKCRQISRLTPGTFKTGGIPTSLAHINSATVTLRKEKIELHYLLALRLLMVLIEQFVAQSHVIDYKP